jgi:YD repeat-containing protein
MKLLTDSGGNYTWEVKLLDGTIYQFKVKVLFGDIFGVHDSTNALSLIQDRYGNKVTITRDDNLHMLRVTSPNGRWIDFGYSDTSTRIATATDNSGRVVSYLYDASGRLTATSQILVASLGVRNGLLDECSLDRAKKVLSGI